MLITCYLCGMRTEECILIYGAWQGTISPFLVHQILHSNPMSNCWPLDYLSSSVAIKCIFSKGQLIMSHIHSMQLAFSQYNLGSVMSGSWEKGRLCRGCWSKIFSISTGYQRWQGLARWGMDCSSSCTMYFGYKIRVKMLTPAHGVPVPIVWQTHTLGVRIQV